MGGAMCRHGWGCGRGYAQALVRLGSRRMAEECRHGKTAQKQDPVAGLVDRNLLCFQGPPIRPLFLSVASISLSGSSIRDLGT